MAQLTCGECGLPLAGDDVFCGNCGARAPEAPPVMAHAGAGPGGTAAAGPPAPPGSTRTPWPGTPSQAGSANGPPGESAMSGRFFGHAPRRPPAGHSNATRYLCAAAYLNPLYANRVIGELIASHRAVAPSVDFDVVPVIRHCLQARRLTLIRDVVLSILILAGLVLFTGPTISALIIALGVAFLRSPVWRRRSFAVKAAIVAGVLVVIGGAVVVLTIFAAIAGVVSGFGSTAPPGPVGAASTAGSAIISAIVGLIVFLALVAGTEIVHTYVKYRTLTERLRPGAPPVAFSSGSPQTEARIAQVEAAQWGNVTLYDGENPFIGTGYISRAWSIAIELERARPSGQASPARPSGRRYVPIDAAELHRVIRERLVRLRDPGLPPNERISALEVADHIVGEGTRRWEGPLIDPAVKIPYSHASQPAIDALIRHPQAGLRYYQRVSVSDAGLAVLSDGEMVIAGADQEVAVSAFVYVAVEGRMLYTEFVTTVLPPILVSYHVIDRMPKVTSGRFLAKVITDAAGTMFGSLIRSPVEVVRTLRLMRREQRSFAAEAAAYDDYVFADVGTRDSARELGASLQPRTYIQDLDVAKYTKIIERLLTDTVLDFLAEKGVDTTAYANSASTIVNAGVLNYGNMSGPVAGGANSAFTQAAQQPAPPPPS